MIEKMSLEIESVGLRWIAIGAILASIAVGMGAFGAHGLEPALANRVEDPAKNMEHWETASHYHMYHSIAIVLVGLASMQIGRGRLLISAAILFSIGIVLFSGLLYVLALTDIKVLGAIVPLGGLAFIVGWLTFAVGVFNANRKSKDSQ